MNSNDVGSAVDICVAGANGSVVTDNALAKNECSYYSYYNLVSRSINKIIVMYQYENKIFSYLGVDRESQ